MSAAHSAYLQDEAEAANKDWLMPSVEQQCADELVSECHQPGTIARGEWIDFQADHGSISAKDFSDFKFRHRAFVYFIPQAVAKSWALASSATSSLFGRR